VYLDMKKGLPSSDWSARIEILKVLDEKGAIILRQEISVSL
jgi:hypothetical protein